MTQHVVMSRVDDPRLSRDEVAVKRRRLADLEAKERAHDDYLAATRMMGQRARLQWQDRPGFDDVYASGYSQCLRDFCQLVVDVSRMRDDMA